MLRIIEFPFINATRKLFLGEIGAVSRIKKITTPVRDKCELR